MTGPLKRVEFAEGRGFISSIDEVVEEGAFGNAGCPAETVDRRRLVAPGAQRPHDLDGKLALFLRIDRRQVARASGS